jgi:hypothetical protein
MKNTLEIQRYEEEIAILSAKIQRLEDMDQKTPHPSLYICARCGLLYQSVWGCGCPKMTPPAAKEPK